MSPPGTHIIRICNGGNAVGKPEGFVESQAEATVGDIPTWSEVLDPGSGHMYYYNITGESAWEKPEGFDAENSTI